MRPGTLFTVCLLVLAVVLLAQLPLLTPLSRVAPLWVLAPTTAMTVVQLVRDARSPSAHDPSSATAASLRRRRQLRITLWIAAVAALVYLLGFLIASAVFLLLYIRTESSAGWWRSLLVTVATLSVIYVVFEVLAGIRFHDGAVF